MGYIYVLLRADFITSKRYVYKIGQTTRHPPHKRLWDYPYGSLFIALIQVEHPIQFEKKLKEHLYKSAKVTCLKEIGVEYFEGSLDEIIRIITLLYTGQNDLSVTPITKEYLLALNRVHCLVNYDPCYFQQLFTYQVCWSPMVNMIPSKEIYESYQCARQWYPATLPDNYVVRCGGGTTVGTAPPSRRVSETPLSPKPPPSTPTST